MAAVHEPAGPPEPPEPSVPPKKSSPEDDTIKALVSANITGQVSSFLDTRERAAFRAVSKATKQGVEDRFNAETRQMEKYFDQLNSVLGKYVRNDNQAKFLNKVKTVVELQKINPNPGMKLIDLATRIISPSVELREESKGDEILELIRSSDMIHLDQVKQGPSLLEAMQNAIINIVTPDLIATLSQEQIEEIVSLHQQCCKIFPRLHDITNEFARHIVTLSNRILTLENMPIDFRIETGMKMLKLIGHSCHVLNDLRNNLYDRLGEAIDRLFDNPSERNVQQVIEILNLKVLSDGLDYDFLYNKAITNLKKNPDLKLLITKSTEKFPTEYGLQHLPSGG